MSKVKTHKLRRRRKMLPKATPNNAVSFLSAPCVGTYASNDIYLLGKCYKNRKGSKVSRYLPVGDMKKTIDDEPGRTAYWV